MDNSLLAVRDINHKYIVVEGGYNDYLSVSAKDVLGNEYNWKYQLITVNEINSLEKRKRRTAIR